jgi:hypothetical protein
MSKARQPLFEIALDELERSCANHEECGHTVMYVADVRAHIEQLRAALPPPPSPLDSQS